MTDRLIGIVTLQGDVNYGNRLQNYALQEAIKSLGFKAVESLDGLPHGETKPLRLRRLVSTAYGRRHEITSRLTKRSNMPRVSDRYECPPLRRDSIRAFSNRYIEMAASGTLDPGRYHRFVVGSDQVWNPAFTHANAEWFLSFASPRQRVAYAASIGIPDLPPYVRSRFRQGLKGIPHLSVREHQAAITIEKLTGSRPQVVLDPTMLLTREQWEGIAVEPAQLQPDSYVATFMLAAGDSVSGSGPDLSAVHQYADSESLSIIDLHSPEDPELISFGPAEFVGAIRGARLLITDSFHATVFATMFHVPFLLVPRGAMNSRFETLLQHTGLRDRELSKITDVRSMREIDWGTVDQLISVQREDSLRFLKDSLYG